jgi:hypothetical protein
VVLRVNFLALSAPAAGLACSVAVIRGRHPPEQRKDAREGIFLKRPTLSKDGWYEESVTPYQVRVCGHIKQCKGSTHARVCFQHGTRLVGCTVEHFTMASPVTSASHLTTCAMEDACFFVGRSVEQVAGSLWTSPSSPPALLSPSNGAAALPVPSRSPSCRWTRPSSPPSPLRLSHGATSNLAVGRTLCERTLRRVW